jgi:hypothetical protein
MSIFHNKFTNHLTKIDMKKIAVLSIFAVVCFASNTFAQKGFILGVKGGVTFNQVTTDAGTLKNNINSSLDTKTGYVLGIYGRFGTKFYLQPEIVLAQKGGTINVQNLGNVKFSYSNIDIPILVGMRVLKIFHVNAGPVATFKVSEDQNLSNALKGYTSGGLNDALSKSSFGYQVGVGVKLLGFDIDLRKTGSLSDISMLNLQNNAQFSQKATGWQFTLAHKII